MTTPTTKIVIVAGQEFAVPVETDNEAIREQLKHMGFADVANATVQTGKKDDGTPTIEFVKKAGTKGLEPRDLVAVFASVPAAPVNQLTAPAARLITQLTTCELTWDDALTHHVDALLAHVEGCAFTSTGAALCTRLSLPAVAVPIAAW
jgi:hypothetical protein